MKILLLGPWTAKLYQWKVILRPFYIGFHRNWFFEQPSWFWCFRTTSCLSIDLGCNAEFYIATCNHRVSHQLLETTRNQVQGHQKVKISQFQTLLQASFEDQESAWSWVTTESSSPTSTTSALWANYQDCVAEVVFPPIKWMTLNFLMEIIHRQELHHHWVLKLQIVRQSSQKLIVKDVNFKAK